MTEPINLPGRGIKPWMSLTAHPILAGLAACIVLAAGLPVAWIKGSPVFSAQAQIQVAPRYMRNLKEDQELDFQSNTQYRQFVQHQASSIGRYDILRDALVSMGPKQKLWRLPDESERRSVERLREQIRVTSVPDTYLLLIGLEGKNKEGLSEVVNAVVNTFLVRMKSEEIYGSDDRVKNLMSRERELLGTIDAKGMQRAKIARDLSLTTFHEGTPNPYDKLVSDLRTKLSDARQRRADANAAASAFDNRGDTNISIRSVQDAVLADPGLNSLKAALSARRAGLLTQVSGLKADHPAREAAVKEIGEIDREQAAQLSKLENTIRSNIRARLMGTADQAAQVEKDLAEELAGLEIQATEFARMFQAASTLTSDIAQARAELDRVRERINYLNIERSSKGFNRLVMPALPPEIPSGPGRKKLMLMVLLAALGAAVAAPIARDLLDRRVFTVNDVQRIMGIPPAGWQIERNGPAAELLAGEQLRRLASTLIRSLEGNKLRVFGLSGIKPGAGTSSLVLDLAGTLRALGYKVLVVEANGFSRDRRYASARPGLVELLHGQVGSAAVIEGATQTLPPRVSVGGKGRVQLDRLDKLKAALNHWSTIADFVLVDMPPLLSSADAELLVRVVGQTLLVVEAGQTTRGEIQRASRLLQSLDPEAVGVIVNRIAAFAGGYMTEMLMESATGRKRSAVYTTPAWRLLLSALRIGRRSRQASV